MSSFDKLDEFPCISRPLLLYFLSSTEAFFFLSRLEKWHHKKRYNEMMRKKGYNPLK